MAKCLKSIQTNRSIKSGTFTTIDVGGRPLYLLDLPNDAIKEVYIGAHSDFMDADKALDLIKSIRNHQPQFNMYRCKINNSSWALDGFEQETAINKALQQTSR